MRNSAGPTRRRLLTMIALSGSGKQDLTVLVLDDMADKMCRDTVDQGAPSIESFEDQPAVPIRCDRFMLGDVNVGL